MPGDGASIGAEYSPLSLPLPLLSLRGLTSSAGPESVDAGSMDSLYGSVSPYGSLAEGPDGRGPRPRRKGRRRSFIKLWCGRESSSATGCCGRRGVDSREVPQLHSIRRASLGGASAGMVHAGADVVQRQSCTRLEREGGPLGTIEGFPQHATEKNIGYERTEAEPPASSSPRS